MAKKRSITGNAARKKDRIRKRIARNAKKQLQAELALAMVKDETKTILPDLPNLDIVVKKELIFEEEESLPSATPNISTIQNASSFLLSVKSEPLEQNMGDMSVPVNSYKFGPLGNPQESLLISQTELKLKTASILPYSPDLDIVKKEPIDDEEVSFPSSSQNSSTIQNASNFMQSVKLEPLEHSVGDMTIMVNPNDFGSLANTGDNSKLFTFRTCNTEPVPKRPNISPSSTNMLLEMEVNDLNEARLPATVTPRSSSNATEKSSLQKQLPAAVILPSSSAVRISNLQAPLSEIMIVPSSSAFRNITKFQMLIPETMKLPVIPVNKYIKKF